MTKDFCDLCKKEIKRIESFTVAKDYMSNRRIYCRVCFTNRKNWQVIQKNAVKDRDQISMCLSSFYQQRDAGKSQRSEGEKEDKVIKSSNRQGSDAQDTGLDAELAGVLVRACPERSRGICRNSCFIYYTKEASVARHFGRIHGCQNFYRSTFAGSQIIQRERQSIAFFIKCSGAGGKGQFSGKYILHCDGREGLAPSVFDDQTKQDLATG